MRLDTIDTATRALVRTHATNKDVRNETLYQCHIMNQLCIKYSVDDILSMCRATSTLGVEQVAHRLKFA